MDMMINMKINPRLRALFPIANLFPITSRRLFPTWISLGGAFSDDASLLKVFSDEKNSFGELAATFYDKVASPKAVTEKERQFAKEIVYGESPVCEGSKKYNRGEKSATRR